MSAGDDDLLRNVTREVLAELLPGLLEEALTAPPGTATGTATTRRCPRAGRRVPQVPAPPVAAVHRPAAGGRPSRQPPGRSRTGARSAPTDAGAASSGSTCAATPTWTRSCARWRAGSRTRATGWRSGPGRLRFRLGRDGRSRPRAGAAPVMRIEQRRGHRAPVREAAAAGRPAGAGAAGGADAAGARPRPEPGSRDREGALMLRATVTGTVWATRRVDRDSPTAPFSRWRSTAAAALVAFDVLGSGVGERVLVATGSVASAWFAGQPAADRRADHRLDRRAVQRSAPAGRRRNRWQRTRSA